MSKIKTPQISFDGKGLTSTEFDDIYFQPENGLAETCHVFLEGNDLSKRFSALPPGGNFVVGELGFGTGLNFLVAVDLFLKAAPQNTHLHYWSVEGYPLSPDHLETALTQLCQLEPQLHHLSEQLCHKYPKGRPGQTQILFAPSITLTLAMGPVEEALGDIDFQADAWFLDGFSPAKNPNMWTPQVMKQIGAHTKKGGSLSTFTVAGSVRRGLLEAGFDIEKSPGFGRKREMLKAVIPAPSSPTSKQLSSAPSVAIVGAGIGGVTTAWHCQRYGMDVTLFEAEAPAAGASGNPIGLLMPRVEANDTPSARFFRDAFLYALQFYHVTAPEHIKVMGGTIAPDQDRPSRFVKLMSSHMWHKDDFHLREDGSLFVTHGATLSPKKTIHKILGYGNIHVQRKRVTSIQQDHRSPVSLYSDENCVWHGDHVVIANGVHAHQFMKFNGMLKASRGQIDIFKGSPPSHIITSGSYIAPFGNNIAAGATYDDISLEEPINIDQTSTEKNKAAAKLLSDHDNIGDTLSSRASVRATTQDRYPIMGHVSPPAALPANAVWGVTGLGSHGLSTGPYLGAHIAHQLAGTISPLPPSALKLIEPMRFQKRKARQEKSS